MAQMPGVLGGSLGLETTAHNQKFEFGEFPILISFRHFKPASKLDSAVCYNSLNLPFSPGWPVFAFLVSISNLTLVYQPADRPHRGLSAVITSC